MGMLDLNPQLSAQLADLGRHLPLSQVSLLPLSQQETLQLLSAVRAASRMACWTREPMKRRSGSCKTPWRWCGPFR
ncbi:MAG: hypothetical protein ACJ8DI_07080 [Ktedonobacteraceae bacterium]